MKFRTMCFTKYYIFLKLDNRLFYFHHCHKHTYLNYNKVKQSEYYVLLVDNPILK